MPLPFPNRVTESHFIIYLRRKRWQHWGIIEVQQLIQHIDGNTLQEKISIAFAMNTIFNHKVSKKCNRQTREIMSYELDEENK